MLCVLAQVLQDANTIADLVTYGREQVVNNRLLPVLQGGFLGSSWWHATCLHVSQAQSGIGSKVTMLPRHVMHNITAVQP